VDLEAANVSLVASTSEMALRDTINALFIFDLMARTYVVRSRIPEDARPRVFAPQTHT
jgi:hypothetical protein